MNRRTFTMRCGAMATTFAARITGINAGAQQKRSLTEFLSLDPSGLRDAYSRSFQMPSTASFLDQISSLYWVTGLGLVLRSEADMETVIASSFRSVPDWYVAGDASMTIGPPLTASLGRRMAGDGASAWYWDVDNPDDRDEVWRTFGIGGVAMWQDRRLLLLWGAAAMENPVGDVFDHAASAIGKWEDDAMSLLPTIAQMPLGMVIADEGSLLKRPDLAPDMRPGHGRSNP